MFVVGGLIIDASIVSAVSTFPDCCAPINAIFCNSCWNCSYVNRAEAAETAGAAGVVGAAGAAEAAGVAGAAEAAGVAEVCVTLNAAICCAVKPALANVKMSFCVMFFHPFR